MHMQFLGMAVDVVCKSEHQGLKKAKERAWESASLGGKYFKRDYAKEKLRENMGQSKFKESDFKE
jgi:hypothetical protein